jgi:ABC-type branched-subunit amino acid transport system substrate-binding protein
MLTRVSDLARSDKGSDPWRVGVLFSRSGFMALIEETQYRGTMIAIEEINESGGINGREVVPEVWDPQSDNSLFKAYARRMLAESGVRTIFGCYTSSSRKAVLPIVERLNGLLWYPTLYEGFEFSPNIVYTGAAPNQNSLSLFNYLSTSYGKRVYFVGSDYVYPRESNRIMRHLIEQSGGEVVGEMYVSLNARREEFFPILRDIKTVAPDVIFSTVVGTPTVYLYQTYADFGFKPSTMPIASLTTTEAEISAMGNDVGEGHITAAPYFEGVESCCGDQFVNRYRRTYGEGERTNMCVEAAYFQVKLFAKALEQVNTLDPDVLRPVVLGTTVDAPQGPVTINPTCGHANVWSRVGRCNANGTFSVVYKSSSAVTADPFMIGMPRVA